MKHQRKRGMVLMMAFITMMMVVMLVGAAFTLMPAQLAASAQQEDGAQAVVAAASGVDYAQSRMQNRPSWRGDLDGTGAMAGYAVNTTALKVFEDKGNVIGLLTHPDGEQSAFRLRFNFQNGNSSPDDGFNQNPAASHLINMADVSFNNLGGWASQDLYKASDVAGTMVVTSTTASEAITKFESVFFVEGLAGPGLRTATVDNLGGLVGNRGVVRQVAASRVGFLSQTRVDAAAYAGGDFSTNSTAAPAIITSAPGASVGHLRSMKTFQTGAGTVLNSTSSQSRAYYSTTAPGIGVQITDQVESATVQNSRWLKLKWSDVPKASPTSPTKLKAGTFFWTRSASGTPQLQYYPEEYSGSGPFVPTTTGVNVSSAAGMTSGTGTGVSLDISTMSTTISDNVYVEPVGSVKGFSVLIDPNYQVNTTMRPAVILDADPSKTSLLSTTGNMYVQGKMEGVGSITTEGNLTIQGTSLFEADTGDSVVLYSKNDITVESIPDTVANAVAPANTYIPGMGVGRARGLRNRGTSGGNLTVTENGDVSFAGAVFAMGNFRTRINNGGVYIRGVLSAYGGDPATQDPGSVLGSGIIDVNAHRVEFMYDPSYLLTGYNTERPSHLDRISWNLQK